MSAKKIFDDFIKRLHFLPKEEASSIAFLVLEKFGIKRLDILGDKKADFKDFHELDKIAGRLLKHEPVQYILEEAEFFGRKFFVSQGVLIPRPETEELVKLILDENRNKNFTLLDIGTGSGCIAITIAKEAEAASAFAIDKSEKALSIASRNAGALNAKVNFIKADIFNFKNELPSLDVIVSNPPYIPEMERSSLEKNVTLFEPESALFVPDHDPLVFYKKIIDVFYGNLKERGKFYFEIHENFGAEIKQLLEKNLKDVRIIKDMSGKDRIATGKRYNAKNSI
jgi:release factor glutamine methyltransferase